MSSDSGTNSESDGSVSPEQQLSARTPGYNLEGSRSNSPNTEKLQPNTNDNESGPSRSQSRSRGSSRSHNSRSRSNSSASNKSWQSQRSRSGESHHSGKSKSPSDGSRRSRSKSVGSNHSGRSRSHRSPSGSYRSRSKSVASNRSRSRSKSNSIRSGRSTSGDSNRSQSAQSNKSQLKSRSRSVSSHRSSIVSNKSRSRSRSKTGSRSPSKSRSRSRSKSRSKSGSRSRSHSRSKSRSRSRPKSKSKSKSKSRSKSRSKSKSRSRSQTPSTKIHKSGGESDHTSGDENIEEKKKEQKKSNIIDSDSEEADNEKTEASAAALFGDADDISSEEEKQTEDREDIQDEKRSDDEREEKDERLDDTELQMPIIDDEQEKEIEEPIPETRIDVEIPKISCDLGRDIHFVKLPNFLSVETRPFDPETYEDEIDEEETLDEEGRARLKLKVENTIRWREAFDKEGNLTKESNARFVRWSDGSLSLHLGSEIFDVYRQPLQGDHNHLFIRQGTGLQGQAVFRTKLSFRPHSTESFTHRKMTLSLADRSQKTTGIKILSQVGLDPDQDRKTLLKKEEEKLKPVRAKPKKRIEGGSGRSHTNTTTYREEEGSDEEGAISLNAIKNKYKGGQAPNKGGAIYSSDEEGSDIEDRRAKKLDKAKALKDSETSDESE